MDRRGLVVSPWAFAVGACVAVTMSEAAAGAQPVAAPDNKRPLDAQDLAEKREDFYVTALPLAGYSPDEGLGLGARVYGYWDGKRDDPLFAYTPYRTRVYVQGYASFRGVQEHEIDWDIPYVADTAYRLRIDLAFDSWTSLNYYGIGESTLSNRRVPGVGSFVSDPAYYGALRAVLPNGTTYAHYSQYSLTQPNGTIAVERDFWGGALRALAGVLVSYSVPTEDTGRAVNATDASGATVRATELPTLIHEDCARGVAQGCGAGWANALKLGLVLDTRDFEPDPTSGIVAEATTEIVTQALGSSWNYARGTATVRGFVPLFPSATRLVFAARGLMTVSGGGVPYWDLPSIALADADINGLGGLRTLRGYRLNRFVGDVNGLANVELRWTAARFAIAGQRFHVMVVPFADAGRVFDSVSRITWRDWKPDGGAGLRIGWNLATVVCADFGASPEGTALYIDFGHQF